MKEKTMHELHGEPNDKLGKHIVCNECGMCKDCKDCNCEEKTLKARFVEDDVLARDNEKYKKEGTYWTGIDKAREEKTLSDQIEINELTEREWLKVSNVKQAIKRLKEELNLTYKSWEGVSNYKFLMKINEKIDKLAGDKLV